MKLEHELSENVTTINGFRHDSCTFFEYGGSMVQFIPLTWKPDTQLIVLRRQYLDNFRRHSGPFTDPDVFDTSDAAATKMEQMNILLV